MGFLPVLLLCFCAVATQEIHLDKDIPAIHVPINHNASVKCCFSGGGEVNVSWAVYKVHNRTSSYTNLNNKALKNSSNGIVCHNHALNWVQLNDTGLYLCNLLRKGEELKTHGTYLHVYRPIEKFLPISESAKNNILTMEGVLLLLSVLIPGICQLAKAKTQNNLDRKRVKEEENLYEGLNLDECNSTYHQIQRSQRQGPYQDVGCLIDEDIQLEKP
ncbi:B-cell antigen receptor complex-associated protein alpha chain [Denticeps clupeoides]|uniref:B-cell antigen receptor complex-associated protein alpha chain n=1 Tax=Denticeps clupeoides TaxID=299321 RepID=UPI0010A3395D|nr:B-cell antigen receptor complex-associated protein alpha chain [Denticeps clupeoides]